MAVQQPHLPLHALRPSAPPPLFPQLKWQDLLSFLEWLCNNLNPVWLEPGETQHLYMDLIDAVAHVSVRVPELGLQSVRCGEQSAGEGAKCRAGRGAHGAAF